MSRKQKERWERLRAALEHLAKPAGVKTALAAELGVSRSALSQWIHGETTPSAELALALHERVYGKPAITTKTKNPSRSTKTKGAKDPTIKFRNETHKSSPTKR